MAEDPVLVFDSVTKLGEGCVGRVAIVGSHGGVYAGYRAAAARLRGVILHDAGVGKDQAGIGALAYLDKLTVAAATVAGESAMIGDGASLAAGVIGHVNATAAACGCRPGQAAMDCARAMTAAPGIRGEAPPYEEARTVLSARPGEAKVIACDSVSLVVAEDAGAIVITASHGELLKNDPSWGKRPDVLAAVFNDAGSSRASRLPDLDGRGIAGATVAAASARIGDARSTWDDGIISHVNRRARALGGAPGQSCKAFVERMKAAAGKPENGGRDRD